jgi:hypothetical protein
MRVLHYTNDVFCQTMVYSACPPLQRRDDKTWKGSDEHAVLYIAFPKGEVKQGAKASPKYQRGLISADFPYYSPPDIT